MNDIDTILSVIENPTRRRILMALVREPHYPLQLSRELGVSQQAIMKNLDILERSGLVESWRESSDKGPFKIVYRPTSEFTLTVDMRNGMFRATLSRPEHDEGTQESIDMALEEVRESLSEIDRHIEELDRMREEMVEKRNLMIRSFMNSQVAGGFDYLERSILYEMLNSPEHNLQEIFRDMGIREDRMTKIINDIEYRHKDTKRRDEE
ncbi:MAG: helix-turn-helix domain-containing protein [Candidatus Methanoplasma sp.]|jgi:predicted transcriptional regulator|nr:helix-turn-helix domain-containing protein [Candidatus Methanoplasma sp.]